MQINGIDGGKVFDWGRTSKDYAKYRDIYPQTFYKKIAELGIGMEGQTVLDIGTGTGVLPRNMYSYGAKWIGTDISENQIEQAKELAKQQNMDIEFYMCPAEQITYPDNTLDAITACQCIWYPDHKICAPNFYHILKPGGRFLILYTAWLPFEDAIAKRSEEIILKYNPAWTGAGETRKDMWVPEEYSEYFDLGRNEVFDVKIPFTREGWHGRMRACRGVGASMSAEELALWDEEHSKMLCEEAPEQFEILHFISYAELIVKK